MQKEKCMENENKKTEHVSYDEFKKTDIRIGTIREVEPVEGADKLLRCQIDFGMKMPDGGTMEPERDIRQIVSGIREYYPDFAGLVGKQVLYIVNLEPRTIRGAESHGMLMAVDGVEDAEGKRRPVFLVPEDPVDAGARVR